MSDAEVRGSFTAAVIRRWPIVAGALVAGALIAGILAMSDRAEPTWEGSVTLRYTPPSSVAGAPTADTFVAMALSPSVQQSAAESMGVNPAEVIGSVEAAISPRDRNIVIIRAEAASAEDAARVAEAVAAVAIREALTPVARHTEYWEGIRIAEAERKLAVAEERSEGLRRQIDALQQDAPERRAFEDQLYTNELRILDTRAAIQNDRFLLEGMQASVTIIEETAVEPGRTFLYDLTTVLRGALLGAFIGGLVAAIVARREVSS